MSAIRPISKRERSRSSISASSLGGRSLAITICFMLSCSALKVWKNSSWVRSLPARNWMSSMSRTSTVRYRCRKSLVLFSWIAVIISLVNFSEVM